MDEKKLHEQEGRIAERARCNAIMRRHARRISEDRSLAPDVAVKVAEAVEEIRREIESGGEA